MTSLHKPPTPRLPRDSGEFHGVHVDEATIHRLPAPTGTAIIVVELVFVVVNELVLMAHISSVSNPRMSWTGGEMTR